MRYSRRLAFQQWLSAGSNSNDRQRLALIYLRQHDQITNSDYQRLSRVNAMVAGQDLRGLVQSGLIAQHGVSRWTSYTLQVSQELPEQKFLLPDEAKILAYVRKHGAITNTECRPLLQVDLQRASYLLKKLVAEGSLRREGKRRWARYRLA